MMNAVADAASEVGYRSLGTFEFLVDEKKRFYFMEANARVQVEHPITEIVYGINLVKAQIRVAAGEKINFPIELEMRGHAIECRINAEDPVTFVPSPGKIDFLVLPGGEGIRVDSAAYGGWQIPPDYDSLVAKIIAFAPTRPLAIKKMQTALETTTIVGIKTNLPLHLQILADTEFLEGKYDTQFMERFLAAKKAAALRPALRIAFRKIATRNSPSLSLTTFSLTPTKSRPRMGMATDCSRPMKKYRTSSSRTSSPVFSSVRTARTWATFPARAAQVPVGQGLLEPLDVGPVGPAGGLGIALLEGDLAFAPEDELLALPRRRCPYPPSPRSPGR